MGTNRSQAVAYCKYKEQSEIETLGGRVVVDNEYAKITTICFSDHFHIQWDIKIQREGGFKIYKMQHGHPSDVWKEIISLNPIVNVKNKKSLYCDYALTTTGDWFYTTVFIAESFSLREILRNLFWQKTDPQHEHITSFEGRLKEPLPEPEKSNVETLEEALLEQIEMQKIKKKYVPKIHTADLESQFNLKDTIKKMFEKKRAKILKEKSEEELSQDEYNELMDINSTERKILRDDDSLKRFIEEYYK